MPSEYIGPDETMRRERQLTLVVYILQAASLLVGITLLIAVIINYVKRADVRGTWLESHFTWQIRTFWWIVVWSILGGVLSLVLVGYLILVAAGVWFIYRIVKGWLYLSDAKPMYEFTNR